MNWATPCAPAGLTAVGLNALSRQMSRVKKPTGSPSAMAEDSTIPHRVASALSVSGPASPPAVRSLSQTISAARASALTRRPPRRQALIKPRMRPPTGARSAGVAPARQPARRAAHHPSCFLSQSTTNSARPAADPFTKLLKLSNAGKTRPSTPAGSPKAELCRSGRRCYRGGASSRPVLLASREILSDVQDQGHASGCRARRRRDDAHHLAPHPRQADPSLSGHRAQVFRPVGRAPRRDQRPSHDRGRRGDQGLRRRRQMRDHHAG